MLEELDRIGKYINDSWLKKLRILIRPSAVILVKKGYVQLLSCKNQVTLSPGGNCFCSVGPAFTRGILNHYLYSILIG
ncbi:Uncharacterised protein [Legionella cherrii]|uniref:Uncharacterized protein n=1 Tax=Legionella cherrii TaxID=28084 RepID=A0A0W0S928_9GAMM|nr:hypothetical protein Lche_2012 [Legionella cherrii]VEB38413.1 Uncharacterised protein [Legionella cherrii]